MRVFWLSLCAVCCYFVGNINPSYIISRVKKFDIREAGSGNAGGSNALITMGKRVGVFCMLFDIFKAFAAVRISMLLLPDEPLVLPIASVAVIVGHIYPVLMGFKGGKGLACLGGTMLAYNPALALITLAVELILVFIVDYICIVPFTASAAFPIMYYCYGSNHNLAGTLILCIATVIMFLKHRENLERIREGKEAHFSFLWKHDSEVDRIKNNMNEEEYEDMQIKRRV